LEQPIIDMMAGYSMQYCSKEIFKDKPGECKVLNDREFQGIEVTMT
jgi:hypothetical protein